MVVQRNEDTCKASLMMDQSIGNRKGCSRQESLFRHSPRPPAAVLPVPIPPSSVLEERAAPWALVSPTFGQGEEAPFPWAILQHSFQAPPHGPRELPRRRDAPPAPPQPVATEPANPPPPISYYLAPLAMDSPSSETLPWAVIKDIVVSCTIYDLKHLLTNFMLPRTGNKDALITRAMDFLSNLPLSVAQAALTYCCRSKVPQGSDDAPSFLSQSPPFHLGVLTVDSLGSGVPYQDGMHVYPVGYHATRYFVSSSAQCHVSRYEMRIQACTSAPLPLFILSENGVPMRCASCILNATPGRRVDAHQFWGLSESIVSRAIRSLSLPPTPTPLNPQQLIPAQRSDGAVQSSPVVRNVPIRSHPDPEIHPEYPVVWIRGAILQELRPSKQGGAAEFPLTIDQAYAGIREIHLLSHWMDNATHTSRFSFPSPVYIDVNRVPVGCVDKGRVSGIPNIRPYLRIGSHNIVRIIGFHGNQTGEFIIRICAVVRYTVESAVEWIVQHQTVPVGEAKARLLRSFFVASDVELVSAKVSLMDSFSQARLQVPAYTPCDHLVDLPTFIAFAQQKCPICTKYVRYQYLRVDSYIQNILSHVPESVTQVEIFPDGSWRSCEEKADPYNSPDAKRKKIIDLISDDDDS